MASAIWLWNGIQILNASQHHNTHVYPNNGWYQNVPWDGTYTWAYDPSFPTTNINGYNIRTTMDLAMDANPGGGWNPRRNGGYTSFTTKIVDYNAAAFQYKNVAGGGGMNVRVQHVIGGACDPAHGWGLDGHGPICYAWAALDPNWPVAYEVFRGAIAHEMGHSLGLQHPGDCNVGPEPIQCNVPPGNTMVNDCTRTIMGDCYLYGYYLPT